MRRYIFSAIAILFLVPLLAACSTTSPPAATLSPTATQPQATTTPTATEPSLSVKVAIIYLSYKPDTVTVPVGTTVTWTNWDDVDPVEHTVTSDSGVFDSGILFEAFSFSHTFMKPGVFSYHCTIHPSITGRVIVE